MITQLIVCWTIANYFKKYYKMIATDLSKQQALDADPKAIQKINFTRNLNRVEGCNNVFHYQRSKRNNFRLFTRNHKSIVNVVVRFSYSVYNNLLLLYYYISIK